MNPRERPLRSTSRLSSLRHALRGVRVWLGQPNARIHCVAAGGVVALGFRFNISTLEWLALVLAIALVITAEAINTALEYAVDVISPDWHPMARDIKDVAAAAVLFSSVGAAVVGGLVFLPHL